MVYLFLFRCGLNLITLCVCLYWHMMFALQVAAVVGVHRVRVACMCMDYCLGLGLIGIAVCAAFLAQGL